MERCVRRGVPTVLFLMVIAGGLAFGAWLLGGKAAPPRKEDAPQSAATAWDPDQLRVMTANIRISEPDDGVNVWPNRRELLVKTLLKYNPDLIGCQEVTPAQGAYLLKELDSWYTHYPRAGVGKIEGENGSRTSQLIGEVTASFASLNTLFYRSDRFEQLDGTAGLVLPDEPQSNPTENTFYTLAVLREKPQPGAARNSAGDTFIVVDTHIRHGESFAVKCGRRLREDIASWLKKYPGASLLLMGDMNHHRGEASYHAIIGAADASDGLGLLTDSFDYSQKKPGERWGNWHAFTGHPRYEWPTDLIFLRGPWTAGDTQIIRDGGDRGIWPSDHFFVMATLRKQPATP